jgi:hypothetical protein
MHLAHKVDEVELVFIRVKDAEMLLLLMSSKGSFLYEREIMLVHVGCSLGGCNLVEQEWTVDVHHY